MTTPGRPAVRIDQVGAESFEIVVKGRLSPTLVAALDGFEVSQVDHGHSTLVGWVPDQARLHGLLELLRDLNIELLSVNPVPTDPAPDHPTPATVERPPTGDRIITEEHVHD